MRMCINYLQCTHPPALGFSDYLHCVHASFAMNRLCKSMQIQSSEGVVNSSTVDAKHNIEDANEWVWKHLAKAE